MRRRDPLTPEQERDLEAIDRALAGEPVERDLRELEELVRDVRATAPVMSPAFAARLERELSEGFPTPRERPPLGRWRRPVGRWLLLPAAASLAAVLVALVVVLGGGRDGETGSVDPTSVGAVQSEQATPDSGGAPAAGSTSSAPGGGSVRDRAAPAPAAAAPAPPAARAKAVAPSAGGLAAQRTVERSASLSLQTTDEAFDSTTDAVNTTVARFGGIVASSQIGAGDAGGGEATFDLRIPTDRLDRALAALSKLGHVTERSQSLDDITGSLHSARERLTDARAERRGLLRALERATTQQQIDSLKAQLRAVAGRIGGLKGRLASVRRRADLAVVSLTVRGGGERGATGGGGRWTPGDAAGDAVRVLEVLAGVVLIGLAVAVPGGLIALAIALAVRQGRRRRRDAALDPA
jgi:Domain of unknown function (DUF4349)